MDNLSFKTETSDAPQTCWRCRTLGLPEGGIAAGELHLVIRDGDKITNRACADCYARLVDELGKMSEGDEWKESE